MYKCAIFSPTPPPLGGIASITSMLIDGFGNTKNILFVNPVGKSKFIGFDLRRYLKNVRRIYLVAGRVENRGKVLFFSSANASFWEKLIWAYVVLMRGRRPVIVMVDGNFPRFYESLNRLTKALAGLLDSKRIVIGAQSASWEQYYKAIFPVSCVKIVGASVDKDFFAVCKRAKFLNNEKVQLLYVGWIIPEKGILDLLDAIEILRSHGDRIRVKLVGSLFDKDKYWKDEINKRGLDNIVDLAGPVYSRLELIRIYSESDIFVFPSHYEGFPVAMLEAITVGLPCIGTNVGGIPDILDHGRAGILIASNSAEKLAAAILTLSFDKELQARLSLAAYERARSNYQSAQLISSYKEILSVYE